MSNKNPIPLSLSEPDTIQSKVETISRLYQDDRAWKALIEWGIVPPGNSRFTEQQLTHIHEKLIHLIGSLRALPAHELRSYREFSDIAIIQTPELLKAYLLIASDETALLCFMGGSVEIAEFLRSKMNASTHELLSQVHEWLAIPENAMSCK